MESHDFAWAFRKMKKGSRVRRRRWAASGLWAEIRDVEGTPWLFHKCVQGAVVPWTLLKQQDLMAEDWELCPAKEEK